MAATTRKMRKQCAKSGVRLIPRSFDGGVDVLRYSKKDKEVQNKVQISFHGVDSELRDSVPSSLQGPSAQPWALFLGPLQ